MSGAAAETPPFVPLVEYNGTTSTGGDSLVQNLNVFVRITLQFRSSEYIQLIDP